MTQPIRAEGAHAPRALLELRMLLTFRVRRFVFFDKTVDTPELEGLRWLVESELSGWVDRLDCAVGLDALYRTPEP